MPKRCTSTRVSGCAGGTGRSRGVRHAAVTQGGVLRRRCRGHRRREDHARAGGPPRLVRGKHRPVPAGRAPHARAVRRAVPRTRRARDAVSRSRDGFPCSTRRSFVYRLPMRTPVLLLAAALVIVPSLQRPRAQPVAPCTTATAACTEWVTLGGGRAGRDRLRCRALE